MLYPDQSECSSSLIHSVQPTTRHLVLLDSVRNELLIGDSMQSNVVASFRKTGEMFALRSWARKTSVKYLRS